jgi:ATP-dependent helicase HrpB
LFSELSKSDQQAALLADPQGKRKIVLATNIAETSLTITGIEVVVDSGIEKTAVFQLNRGITHLQTQKISQASAIQRAGRAGRLSAGTCYRLWAKEHHDRLAKQSTPQILQTDMSSFILETAIWGSEVNDLALIDQPSDAQLQQGRGFLKQLELFDNQHKLTGLGRKAHALGSQPSLAIMLLKSAELSRQHLSLACALAALIESKDPLGHGHGVELSSRLQFLLGQKNHLIWQLIRQWHKKLACQLLDWPLEDVAVLIGFAFPHWLAKQRQNERYQLANGSGAVLPLEDALIEKRWLAVANMQTSDKQQENAQIRYAEALSQPQLEQYFSHLIENKEQLEWDVKNQKIISQSQKVLGKIIIQQQPMQRPSKANIMLIWQKVISELGIQQLPFSEGDKQLIYRVQMATKLVPQLGLADFSDQGLLHTMHSWLMPYLEDKLSWQQLKHCDFLQQLKTQIPYSEQQQLNKLLPERLALPSGRTAQIVYTEDHGAVLSVRIQELYGLKAHPMLANAGLAIKVELLSPAQRPIQMTKNLPGFWQGSYKEVQKEMKGRYPRHYWPDDPANAQATTTTKKRMNAKP